MPALVDRAGLRYGRLMVIARAPTVKVHARWHCVCDCGATSTVNGTALGKHTFSCGCYKREINRASGLANARHGMTSSRVYSIWTGMRKRCSNANDPVYPRYGGRGIKVCERWQTFENFLADMGEGRPGLSIDRIDNDGDYSPENCRWATAREQSQNRSNVRRFAFAGELLTLPEIARRDGIKYATAYYRFVIRAQETPAPTLDWESP